MDKARAEEAGDQSQKLGGSSVVLWLLLTLLRGGYRGRRTEGCPLAAG